MFGSLLRVSINAFIPDLLEEKRANKANAMFQSIGALVLIVGPLLASLFYEWSTMAIVLLWSAVSYAVSGKDSKAFMYIMNEYGYVLAHAC